MRKVIIYDAIRTPRGKTSKAGFLHELTAFDMLSALYCALEQRNQLNPHHIDDVILGCATQVGEQGGNIAKTSSLYHGWPDHVSGMTVNRYCSSGLDAIILGSLKIASAMSETVVAGGIEMMSRIPMLSDHATAFTDAKLAANMNVFAMGCGADLIASLENIDRHTADTVALTSQKKALFASNNGYFSSIIPVENPVRKIIVSKDQCIRPETTLEKLAAMEPSFQQLGDKGTDTEYLKKFTQLKRIDHIHSVGNSPSMADGAAAILLSTEEAACKLSIKPRAHIVSMVTCNDDSRIVLGGCIKATAKLLHQENLTPSDVDLFEIQEAFAATLIKCQRNLGISDDKLNVNGGCIALGHPLGATGAMMLGTLLDELDRMDLERGIVATSGAAGAGTAILIERI